MSSGTSSSSEVDLDKAEKLVSDVKDLDIYSVSDKGTEKQDGTPKDSIDYGISIEHDSGKQLLDKSQIK